MQICDLENLENVLSILSWNSLGHTLLTCIVVYFGMMPQKKESCQIVCLIQYFHTSLWSSILLQ